MLTGSTTVRFIELARAIAPQPPSSRNPKACTGIDSITGGTIPRSPMIKTTLYLTTAVAMLTAVVTTPASSMPNTGAAIRDAAEATDLVDNVAIYVVEGRRYCFYFSGWHGPGWYRCGYAFRRGLGWGGTYGWQGWKYGPAARRFGGGFREGTTVREGRSFSSGTSVRGSTSIREGTTTRERSSLRSRGGVSEGARIQGGGTTTSRESVRGGASVQGSTTGSGERAGAKMQGGASVGGGGKAGGSVGGEVKGGGRGDKQ
jgi:hypothetical protein